MSTPAPSSESVCVEHSNLFPRCHSCQKCEESFDNCNNLWSHMFIKHENSDFVCNLCPPGSKVVVKRPSSLRKHMQDVHSVYHMDSDLCAVSRLQDITFPCEECKELCVLSKYCIKHKDCSKAMSTPAPSSESVCIEHGNLFPKCHSCQKCEESFDNCNNLWSHMFIKHENSDFVCNLCPSHSKVLVRHCHVENVSCSYSARHHACLQIFNHPLTSGVFPSDWRSAEVIPLNKVASPASCSDFRLVAILPVLSKALVKIATQQIIQYIEAYNILDPFQSGFRKSHSTATALVKVTHDIRLALDTRKVTVLVLLDMSKVFDSVDFDVLLAILEKLKVSISALSWIDSYLRGRRQRVKQRNVMLMKLSKNCPVNSVDVL
ncbi:hypothetical protein M8J77_006740 [Diaphorina citri]|nr:hypothetical protein M8J77_006740 [Diaphorina citri]